MTRSQRSDNAWRAERKLLRMRGMTPRARCLVSSILLAIACGEKDKAPDLDSSNVNEGPQYDAASPTDDEQTTPAETGQDDADDPASSASDDGLTPGQSDAGLFGGDPPPVSVVEPSDPVDPPPAADDGPSAESPLTACETAVALGEDPRIDDFEDRNSDTLAVDNRGGGWYDYDDDTSAAVQVVEWIEAEGASPGSTAVLHVQSAGFPEYSGVGFGLRWTETGAEHCYYDASYYDGIAFWVKGNASIRLALQNPAVRPVDMGGTCPLDAACYDSHGYQFVATDEWTGFRISFSSLTQAGWGTPVGAFKPQELFTAEFQFTGGSAYEVWFDDISFYKEDETPSPDPVPPVEVLDGGAPDEPTSETGEHPMDAAATSSEPEAAVDAGLEPPSLSDAGVDASVTR
jgi:hypothetical protein